METEAQRDLRYFLANLADIGRDIERFERSERPFDQTGLACLRQRLGLALDHLAEKTWTSYEAEKAIEDLESRLSKLG